MACILGQISMDSYAKGAIPFHMMWGSLVSSGIWIGQVGIWFAHTYAHEKVSVSMHAYTYFSHIWPRTRWNCMPKVPFPSIWCGEAWCQVAYGLDKWAYGLHTHMHMKKFQFQFQFQFHTCVFF
jgi:hypothetical protein